MASETQGAYYVPEQSKLPLLLSAAMFLLVFGLGSWMNGVENGPLIFLLGFGFLAAVLYNWFSAVITENRAGLANAQLKRSYVWGMGWFIFSEVMFFAAFFGALWYVRNMSLPALSSGPTEQLIWPGFEGEWPLMTTPDAAVNGERAAHVGPREGMGYPGFLGMLVWLPFWNTMILMASSVTVHWAHTALKNNNREKFIRFLAITVGLGVFFLFMQAYEYYHAYEGLGLTLASGIYGATFFMLTGFHGFHVTIGTFMLAIMLLRARKGHFRHDDAFGFESASWYWHFVDVVWLGLFIFVYVLA